MTWVERLMAAVCRQRFVAGLRSLWRDRGGSALMYTTLSLPVLIGFALLAIDGSRYMNLHSSLQHAADGMALAAAGELDRRPDSMVRAKRAIDNELVKNQQRFGEEGLATIEDSDVQGRFLKELPDSDSSPMPPWGAYTSADCEDCVLAYLTDDLTDSDLAGQARFVEIRVDPKELNTLIPASFIGGNNTVRTSATAVAGFDSAVCEFTPVFICNPYEGTGTSIHEAAADPAERKKQLRLHSVPGGGSQLTPGNFGLLRAPNDPSPPEMRRMLAIDGPDACYLETGVDTKPGLSGVGKWINVRFDMYAQGNVAGVKNDPRYRPANNVRKGYRVPATGASPQCNKVPDTTGSSKGLPRDACFASGTCPATWRGDGNFASALVDYWMVNYQEALPTELVGKSRYDVYRYEITNNLMPRQSNAPTREHGGLYCSSSATSADPDRRILYGAVINCLEHDIHGNEVNIPVEGFAEFFLTEPVINDEFGPETIWLELKGMIQPGSSNSVARDRVQLFR